MKTIPFRRITLLLSVSLIGLTLTSSALAEEKDLKSLGAELKAAVAAGDISEADAIAKYTAKVGEEKGKSKDKAAGAKSVKKDKDGQRGKGKPGSTSDLVWSLLQAVENDKLTAEQAMTKYKYAVEDADEKGAEKRAKKRAKKGAPEDLEKLRELSKSLPKKSTAGDEEGPASTFIFGWAANATHRFMDNSHLGEPRKIRGLSFRLDHRDHDAIGRTWEKVSVRVAHGNWGSLKYNESTDHDLVDEPVTVFDRQWSFPTLKGLPPLTPASWGGPQNSLSFRFDEPFEYNGKDAIYVEFIFSEGKAEDGREWRGELPKGFEYYLDSMPEVGGWREVAADGRKGAIYTGSARVATAASYTAGGQSLWTSSPKGLPYMKWDVEK